MCYHAINNAVIQTMEATEMAIDLAGFQRFEGRWKQARSKSPRVSVQRRGVLMLNEAAYKALGSPKAVELYHDPNTHQMAIKATDDLKSPFSIPFRIPHGQAYHIGVGAFLEEVGFDTEKLTIFDNPQIADGVLLLDPAQAMSSARQKRTARTGAPKT